MNDGQLLLVKMSNMKDVLDGELPLLLPLLPAADAVFAGLAVATPLTPPVTTLPVGSYNG